ncbi:MAG: radical SAM protein [Candidatus Alcyoniella australis]|nr:radical SAM protein [Candidatus Alcyoniella australis]
MRVALVHPPESVQSIGSEIVQHPINIASIAAYIRRENDAEVELWDYAVLDHPSEDFRERMRRFKPQIVGFSCMTPLIVQGAELARIAKQEDPEVLVVVGGPHVSAIPEHTLEQYESFDISAIGEGEQTMSEIIHALEHGLPLENIASTAVRIDGAIRRNELRDLIHDLDDLPYPARDLIDLELYKGSSSPGLDSSLQRITELFTSRGCPMNCIFCASAVTHRNKVRFRSAEHVLGEVRQCVEQYGIQHFTIDDDTFTYGHKRLTAICDGLRELGVSWDCDSRVDSVNPEVLKMMADSGCKKIAFGVETGSPRMLELIKKQITVEQIEDGFDWAHRAGILTSAFIMIGSHPSETIEDLDQTLALIKRIRPDFVLVYIAVPYPGTELYHIMHDQELVFTEDWNEYDIVRTIPKWRTENFSPDQLVALQEKLYRKIYFTPRFIAQKLFAIRSLDDFRYMWDKGFSLLSFLGDRRKQSKISAPSGD